MIQVQPQCFLNLTGWVGSIGCTRAPQRCSIGFKSRPLKDIHRVVLENLLWYLGCVLRVIGRFSSRMFLYIPAFIFLSIHRVLTPPSPCPDSSAQMARKNPAGYKPLPLTDKGGLCAHRDLHSSRNCSVPFRRFMLPDNPVSEVYRELLWLQACCALWRALSAVGSYIDRCEPSKSCPINWIEHRRTPSQTEKKRLMISGNRIHPSFMANTVNTCIHVMSIFLSLFKKCKNIMLTLWPVVCNFEGDEFHSIRNKAGK